MKTLNIIKWLLPALMLAYLVWLAASKSFLMHTQPLLYWGVLAVGAAIIVALHLSLRRKQRKLQQQQDDQYGTYGDKPGA